MNQDSQRRPHPLLLPNGIFSKWYEKYKGNSLGLISNLHSHSQSRHEKTAFLTPICNESNKIISFKSNLDSFIQKKDIPHRKYGNDNILQCERGKFTGYRSMHNIQRLSGSGRS